MNINTIYTKPIDQQNFAIKVKGKDLYINISPDTTELSQDYQFFNVTQSTNSPKDYQSYTYNILSGPNTIYTICDPTKQCDKLCIGDDLEEKCEDYELLSCVKILAGKPDSSSRINFRFFHHTDGSFTIVVDPRGDWDQSKEYNCIDRFPYHGFLSVVDNELQMVYMDTDGYEYQDDQEKLFENTLTQFELVNLNDIITNKKFLLKYHNDNFVLDKSLRLFGTLKEQQNIFKSYFHFEKKDNDYVYLKFNDSYVVFKIKQSQRLRIIDTGATSVTTNYYSEESSLFLNDKPIDSYKNDKAVYCDGDTCFYTTFQASSFKITGTKPYKIYIAITNSSNKLTDYELGTDAIITSTDDFGVENSTFFPINFPQYNDVKRRQIHETEWDLVFEDTPETFFSAITHTTKFPWKIIVLILFLFLVLVLVLMKKK